MTARASPSDLRRDLDQASVPRRSAPQTDEQPAQRARDKQPDKTRDRACAIVSKALSFRDPLHGHAHGANDVPLRRRFGGKRKTDAFEGAVVSESTGVRQQSSNWVCGRETRLVPVAHRVPPSRPHSGRVGAPFAESALRSLGIMRHPTATPPLLAEHPARPFKSLTSRPRSSGFLPVALPAAGPASRFPQIDLLA